MDHARLPVLLCFLRQAWLQPDLSSAPAAASATPPGAVLLQLLPTPSVAAKDSHMAQQGVA